MRNLQTEAPLPPVEAPVTDFHTQDVVRKTHGANARYSSCERLFFGEGRYGNAAPYNTHLEYLADPAQTRLVVNTANPCPSSCALL